MAPILEVDDLRVDFETYDGRQQVLNGVNLVVNEGETVAIVGESGCGKSVTAKTIIGTLPQPPGEIVSGEVRYRGRDLLSDADEAARVKHEEMAMIFQDPMTHLSPVFKVGDMMADIINHRGKEGISWFSIVKNALRPSHETDEELRERCAEMLGKLQIPDPEGILDRYPVELSGGMRQRVLIGMALITDPDFLIADEPTTALDVTVQDQILEILSERIRDQDLSVLYITHNLGVARKLADRIYVMYAGEVAEVGTTEEIFEAPLHPYTRGLMESIPKLTEFDGEGIEGLIPDYTNPPSGCRFHPRCPAAIDGVCDREVPPMVSVSDTEAVSCHLYEDGMDLDAARSIADAEIDYHEYDIEDRLELEDPSLMAEDRPDSGGT